VSARVAPPARTWALLAVSAMLLTVVAVAMLAVAVVTLFRARRLYSEVMTAWLGRAMLALWGVRCIVHRTEAWPSTQVVYVSNHSSTLDVFALIALALPRTRFFLAGYVRKVFPVALLGALIRIFWTVPQQYPERRVRIFQRADRILRRTGDSVYLSPEGIRVTGGRIGHFNKGAFHLATSLRAPIVPLYIRIPPEIDPGRGFDARAGTIDVYVLPPIDTSAWRLEDVERNKEAVRDLFVRTHAAMHTPAARLVPDLHSSGPTRGPLPTVVS
jgi:1-acyl-sn-glycerol-3-phosphate acyltransferase